MTDSESQDNKSISTTICAKSLDESSPEPSLSRFRNRLSISSRKIIEGAFFLAFSNNCAIAFSDSPTFDNADNVVKSDIIRAIRV